MNIQGKLIEIFDTIQISETFKKREFIIQDNKNPEYIWKYPISKKNIVFLHI